MILAVLEKRAGLPLSSQDVFVNIAGGLKVADTATDLGIAAAIYASQENLSIDPGLAFAGEIGLSGEIRAVNRMDQRIREVEKLGLKGVVISGQLDLNPSDYSIRIHQVDHISQCVSLLGAGQNSVQ